MVRGLPPDVPTDTEALNGIAILLPREDAWIPLGEAVRGIDEGYWNRIHGDTTRPGGLKCAVRGAPQIGDRVGRVGDFSFLPSKIWNSRSVNSSRL